MKIKLWQLHLIIVGFSVANVACTASRAAQASHDPQISGPHTTVVIDAGHGGFDRGGIPGQRIPEKEMTLDVAQRLKTVLAASGYNVVTSVTYNSASPPAPIQLSKPKGVSILRWGLP